MTYKINYRNTNLTFMSDNLISRMSSWKHNLFFEVHVKLNVKVTVKVNVKVKVKIKLKLNLCLIWIVHQIRSEFVRLTSVLDEGD